ncbi:protein kinase domain-containing protein [Kitasatospora sp. McL0602]|uniref:protein kinase domain-containing protein n=1 Tax=Kitasatospora sp. McL0602 TaxID=3439530 RepID=UPI003F89FA5F
MADTQRPGDGEAEHAQGGEVARETPKASDETAATTALPAAAQTPGRGTAAPLGTVGDGRYRLTHRLGRGGMAEVFAAQDVRLARTVAVKLLRSELAQDDVARLRFTREAHSVAGLNHHSIVAVYDTGEEHHDGESTPYIVMELVEGRTVRELLVDESAPPVDQALIITAGVLEALAYSHRHGIVHRDIKPANVIITTGGAVKVMDFGIARALTGAASTMTQTGMVMGTPQYLSPEQALGKPVDHRSDLYAAGCMLYELLTLRPPFVGDTPLAVVYQHVQDAPVAPSQVNPRVPHQLDELVLRSLAKNPDDRFQSADEFRAHLQHALREMHGAAGAGYAAGAAAAAAAAAGLAAAGAGTGGQPGYEGTPSGSSALTTPLGAVPGAGADPTSVLPYSVGSPYNTPSAPYGPPPGGGGGGGGYDDQGPEHPRRSPMIWIVGAVLLVLAGTAGIVLALNNNDTGKPGTPVAPQTSTSVSTEPTTEDTTPSPQRSTGTNSPSTGTGTGSNSGSYSTPPPSTHSSTPSPSSSRSASASPSPSGSPSASASPSSSPSESSTPSEPVSSPPPSSASAPPPPPVTPTPGKTGGGTVQ